MKNDPMDMRSRNRNRKKLEKFLTRCCRKSPFLYQALLDRPKETLEKLVQMDLPAGLKIEIVPEEPDDICIVLPLHPEIAAAEQLHDSDLENVCGGTQHTFRILDRIVHQLNGRLT